MRGGKIRLRGYDLTHRINAVRFNECVNAGVPVDSLSQVDVNRFVTDLRFNEPLPDQPEAPEGHYELEALESSVRGGVQYIADNPEASAGRHRVFIPTEVGATIEHSLTVPSAGSYHLKLSLRYAGDLDALSSCP